MTLGGEPQIVSFSYSAPLAGLVGVHVPLHVIEQHARAGMFPWALAMGLLVLGLFPAAMGLMLIAHRRYEAAAVAARNEREALSERRSKRNVSRPWAACRPALRTTSTICCRSRCAVPARCETRN